MRRRPAASRAARTIASSSFAVVAPAERPPADLEGAEALLAILRDDLAHRVRLFHQQRAVGLHAVAVGAAEQPADRLAGRLAQDVPQRDVDAADRVGQGAAAPHPEGVLMQLLGDPLRLQRILARTERLQHLQPGLHEPAVGEDAAIAGDARIGVDRDDGVDEILRPDLRDQPPFGLSPNRGAATIDLILI